MKYLSLGKRIKGFRERKGLSLEDLSLKAKIPLDKLKKIEEDEEQPIIATLIRLSKVLEVNVADIFRERPIASQYEIVRKNKRERVKPLVQPNEHKIFDYVYELLTSPSDDKHMHAYLIEVPPHQSQGPSANVSHEGEEFIYVLEGSIRGEINGEKFHLDEGDSLYLHSSSPHVFYNPGKTTARAVTVIYPY